MKKMYSGFLPLISQRTRSALFQAAIFSLVFSLCFAPFSAVANQNSWRGIGGRCVGACIGAVTGAVAIVGYGDWLMGASRQITTGDAHGGFAVLFVAGVGFVGGGMIGGKIGGKIGDAFHEKAKGCRRYFNREF